jgi:hypothetical protein
MYVSHHLRLLLCRRSEDGVEGRVGIQLNLFPYQDIYQDAGAMVYMVVEKEVRGR